MTPRPAVHKLVSAWRTAGRTHRPVWSARCGARVVFWEEVHAFWRYVTCPTCLAMQAPPRPPRAHVVRGPLRPRSFLHLSVGEMLAIRATCALVLEARGGRRLASVNAPPTPMGTGGINSAPTRDIVAAT